MDGAQDELAATMRALGAGARGASSVLATAPAEAKAAALRAAAIGVRARAAELLAANAIDLALCATNELSAALTDRTRLDAGRIEAIALGLEDVAALPDPVGAIEAEWTRPNGLAIRRVRVPIGVIGIVYEARPNVTADAGALCLKSGNAAILRGGQESFESSKVLVAILQEALVANGLPRAAIQLVPTRDRAAVGHLLTMPEFVDVVVPRGGKSLIERVLREAKVPVIAHLEGLCHTYVHASADAEAARRIAINAKLRRVSVCGATETLLVDRACALTHLPPILHDLLKAGCEIRGDTDVAKLDPRVRPATELDWRTEHLDAILNVRIVDGLDAAIDHVNGYGSHHTDAIVARDEAAARAFTERVDSAIVLVNASTQFADGGEFGFGAEIGISTGRLPPRGPVGAEQLTSYKYVVLGAGQIPPVTGAPGAVVPARALGFLPRRRVGLLGGSFNPAHEGHRWIALEALARLGLDEVWFLVSPGNPLKPERGMAPLAARLASARALADGHPRLRATAIETALGTRYTADTLAALKRRFPRVAFVWLMGADNLTQLPAWNRWSSIFRAVPVAVLARPAYSVKALAGKAARRFSTARRAARFAPFLAGTPPPAWVFLHTRLHPASASAIREGRVGRAG